ncbi:hypothetical protein MBLNU457_3176t1 [Dothideomycetes sp. NU457]
MLYQTILLSLLTLTAAASQLAKCPSGNNTIYTTPNGATWLLECGTNRVQHNIPHSAFHTKNLTACLTACSDNPSCVTASLVRGKCHLKSGLGKAKKAKHANSARLLAARGQFPTCPSSDGAKYTAASGAVFEIECGVDRVGNDLAMKQVPSGKLADCIGHCDATAGCVDVSMSGTACYLKSAAGAKVVKDQVWGARRVSGGCPSVVRITQTETVTVTTTMSPAATGA